MALITRPAFKCDRCGHEWISDRFTHKEPPIACGLCKSPYWNRGEHREDMRRKKNRDNSNGK